MSQSADLNETGQLLPATEAALEGGDLEQLVQALGTERVIVPVPVETHPDRAEGQHAPIDLNAQMPLPVITSPAGPAVTVYSSAAALAADDPTARPYPLSSSRAAATALALGAEHLWLRSADHDSVVVPRPALEALAAGDTWQAPWKDTELRDQLQVIASGASPAGRAVRVGLAAGENGILIVDVTVGVGVQQQVPPETLRREVAQILAEVSGAPRLRGAAHHVEVRPRLEPMV